MEDASEQKQKHNHFRERARYDRESPRLHPAKRHRAKRPLDWCM
jgi:hypothetical protein